MIVFEPNFDHKLHPKIKMIGKKSLFSKPFAFSLIDTTYSPVKITDKNTLTWIENK